MSLEKFITITSAQKDDITMSNSDFTVTLKERFYTQNVIGIVITDCVVPNVFYNIRDGVQPAASGALNNILTLKEGANPPVTVILPPGQYNVTQLITTLTPLINAQLTGGNVVTIVQDPITQLLTFIFSLTATQILDISRIDLANVLGFTGPSAQALVITAPYPPDLSGYQTVYIHSFDLADSNGVDGRNGMQPIIEMVSLNTTPYGAFAYKQNNDTPLATITYDQPRNINRVTVQLKDAYNILLDIGTKQMTITFKVLFAT